MTTIPKVGDILEASWGYDQTNINYYQVVSVTPSRKSVRIRPIGARLIEAGGPYGNQIEPAPGSFKTWDSFIGDCENGDLKRVRPNNRGYMVTLETFARAYHRPADAGPSTETDPLFGH